MIPECSGDYTFERESINEVYIPTGFDCPEEPCGPIYVGNKEYE